MSTWWQLSKAAVFFEFYRLIRQYFGLDIAICRPDGKGKRLLGGPGHEVNRFCKAFHRLPDGPQMCLKSDGSCRRRAVRTRRPVRYICHAGLTEFVVPIADRDVIGHLRCGQILDHVPAAKDRRRLMTLLGSASNGQKEILWRAYRQSTVIPPDRQKVLLLLLHIMAKYLAIADSRNVTVPQDRGGRVVAKALEYLASESHKDLRVADIASAVGASRRHMARLVLVKTGEPLLNHLQRIRVDNACRQLRDTDAKIVNVAMDCGFGSVQQFNRIFWKLTGCSPGRWRKKAQSTLSGPAQ